MNAQDQSKLADNLTAMADNWSLPELTWIIQLLTTIRDARRQAVRAEIAARQAADRKVHGTWETKDPT